MVVGFIVGLLIAVTLRQAFARGVVMPTPDEAERYECPRCAEHIRRQASMCRFCGLHLPEVIAQGPVAEDAAHTLTVEPYSWKLSAGIIAGLVVAAGLMLVYG